MKVSLILAFALTLGCANMAVGLDKGHYSALSENPASKEKWKSLNAVLNAADHIAEVTNEGEFDIGIGSEEQDGRFEPITFRWKDLSRYYRSQKNKKLVVVRLQKRPQQLNENDIIDMANNFKGVGYERVVIVRELASGWFLELDANN